MTDVTHVDRLDFSKPPPGFSAPYENPVNDCWHLTAPIEEQYFTACRQIPHEAITHAWAHYKARHDPPGMLLWVASLMRDVPLPDGEDGIRSAAWTWYERRLAVSSRVDAVIMCDRCGSREPHTEAIDEKTSTQPWCVECDAEMGGLSDPWPESLTWPDEQVATVERWLVDSTVVMPEVLRG